MAVHSNKFAKTNFNRPYLFDNFFEFVKDTHKEGVMAGDGKYTKLSTKWFEDRYNVKKALLVHSGTAALEMAAILAEIKPGDEVIMPSYTFVSTANAFVLRGAVPVFVDIRKDNKNIDENLIEAAITPKTKAICPVHYAGVACEMDKIMELAKKYNLIVIEDAAQAFDSYYKGKPLGTIGDYGCLSFHETKNVISGEGGMIFINNEKDVEKAEIVREKGTNRSRFFRGQVDKYTWVEVGSSYLPSDIIAAYLYSGLLRADEINARRVAIWNKYYEAFKPYQDKGLVELPVINDFATNNGHMFYLVFSTLAERSEFIAFLREKGVYAPFHYIPLHNSPAGEKFGRTPFDMNNTCKVSDTLVRLPMYFELSDEILDYVIETTKEFLNSGLRIRKAI